MLRSTAVERYLYRDLGNKDGVNKHPLTEISEGFTSRGDTRIGYKEKLVVCRNGRLVFEMMTGNLA